MTGKSTLDYPMDVALNCDGHLYCLILVAWCAWWHYQNVSKQNAMISIFLKYYNNSIKTYFVYEKHWFSRLLHMNNLKSVSFIKTSRIGNQNLGIFRHLVLKWICFRQLQIYEVGSSQSCSIGNHLFFHYRPPTGKQSCSFLSVDSISTKLFVKGSNWWSVFFCHETQ